MIHIRDLWKEYGSRPILKGVSLEIAAGERVALVGPNGSGKTTMLRCLLGLLQYRGQITIGGCDPLTDHVRAQAQVAYVPQRAPALPGAVGELCNFWAAERRQPVARLTEIAREMHLDLPEVRRRRFTELSGGMQQKLLASMALATDCGVMLLDEPTANLDPPARAAFFAAITARDPAPTLLLSSHRLEELQQLVDRVVVLEEGRVAFDDRLDRLLSAGLAPPSSDPGGVMLQFPRREP